MKYSKFAESGEKKNVGLWIRVSTDMQVETESPEHHEKRGRYYAEAKGWNIVEVYRLEAQSGKSVMNHAETQRMLKDLRSGRIAGLIFSKLARLARNTRELLEFADVFREVDGDLISLQESIDTSTPAGRLFYTMIAAMAQWEREEIAERVAASVPVRARMGKSLGGAAPFGYRWEGHDLVPDAGEAPVRKLMYDLFLTHQRKRIVARMLNEAGHRTRNGSKFTDTTVTRLLKCPTAMGIRRANYTSSLGAGKSWVLKPEDEWIELPIEPIVDKEIWERANAILTDNHKARKRIGRPPVQLFAGIAFCHCGSKMRVPSNNKKYDCPNCHNKIGTSVLEDIFHHQLKSFVFSQADVLAYLESANNEMVDRQLVIESLQAEEVKLRAEMKKVYQLYSDGGLTVEGFSDMYRPMEERLAELKSSLPELQGELDFMKIQLASQDETISEFQNLYERWPSLTLDEKRLLVEHSVERISVGDGEVNIDLGYMPSPSEVMASSQRGNVRADILVPRVSANAHRRSSSVTSARSQAR